jgi:hypothetical protein
MAALPSLSKGETPLGGWLRGLLARAHVNTAVVALAAKLSRIACAVLQSGKRFEMKATSVSSRGIPAHNAAESGGFSEVRRRGSWHRGRPRPDL